MICSDIWYKYHERYFGDISIFRRVKFETILKYHEWYLCKISRTNHAITYTKSFEHHHHHYHQKCIELSTSTAQTTYNNVEFGVMNAGFMAIYG